MIRTALRLGITPFLALALAWNSASGPMSHLLLLIVSAPFVLGALGVSFARFKADPLAGAVPLWAARSAPLVWLASALVIVLVAATDFPLRFSLRASQTQLDKLVSESQADKPLKLPRQIGNFNVTDVLSNEFVTIIYLDGGDGGDGAKLIWLPPKYRKQVEPETLRPGETWIFQSD